MKKKIAILRGDGIGPEVVQQGIKVLNAIADRFDHKFEYEEALIGACAIDKKGNPLPDESIEICQNSDAVLLGAVGHPKYDQNPDAKVRPEQGLLKLRKTLGLFSNVRPVTSYESLLHLSPIKEKNARGIDFVVYRELTGGIYFGEKKYDEKTKTASDLCSYSEYEIERIAHLAFKEAGNRRKQLTLVDKANVLETSRLWRRTVEKVSQQYPEIEYKQLFVDNAAMQIILNPAQFDVILTENMFGDIITDEASVLAGSLGLLPSASLGGELGLFEPIHGSYPQAAGLDIANPVGTILSVAMMMDYFELYKEGNLIRSVVEKCINHGFVTQDINKDQNFPTSKVGDIIAEMILDEEPSTLNAEKIIASMSTII